MSLRAFCVWLGSTPWSLAIHQSLWLYPVIESVHVLSICLFLGLVIMLDLRLLGVTLREVPVSQAAGRLLPWAVVGFVPLTISGALLVYQEPLRAYDNIFFRTKAVLLILAGLNALLFHKGIYRSVSAWDFAKVTPARARMAGWFSLILWAGIVIAGRLIAYNWFNKA